MIKQSRENIKLVLLERGNYLYRVCYVHFATQESDMEVESIHSA